MKGKTILCGIHATDPDVKYTTGFCEVNVELAPGNEVYVQGNGFFNGHDNAFTGFNGMFISVTE